MNKFTKIFTVLVTLVMLAACSSQSDAERALKGAGYTDIQTHGWAMFGCNSDQDSFTTKFTATGPTGQKVSGVVCSDWLKGSTIRLD